MEVKKLEEHKPPSYYIKKRLFANKSALAGMMIILIAHIVAVLGYLIMPDDTPNANDRTIQLKKLEPGAEANIMKFRENRLLEDVNFFEKMLFGQPKAYTNLPYTDLKIVNLTIYINLVGADEDEQEKKYSLVDAVFPLYKGKSQKFTPVNGENYRIEGDKIIYLDINENINEISRADLIKKFEKENLEKRIYLLGTDKAGRDLLSMLIFGTRISLSIGFVSVIIALLVGISLGAMAGFFGGNIDNFIMWLMTVVWSIPSIMLVVAISLALHSRGVGVAFVAIGLTTWVEVARVVRGQIFSIKEKLFIEAARAFGINTFRIIFYHIMPNLLGTLIVIATSNFASAILIEAGLSFLGLSVQSPTPSWGVMINEGFHAIGTHNSWHLVLFPSLCVSLIVLAFNLFGNGLRDAFDPKTVLN